MARQHARSGKVKSIAGAAIVWIGMFVLFASLGWAVPQLSDPLCGAAGEGLGVLPSIVLAAWRALPDYAFDHQRLSECFLQMLLSFLPLLLVVMSEAL
jgi:hypothetical protein